MLSTFFLLQKMVSGYEETDFKLQIISQKKPYERGHVGQNSSIIVVEKESVLIHNLRVYQTPIHFKNCYVFKYF